MIILGIETSCDETAAAVVTDQRQILADEVRSQWEEHRPYGGIVPEIAARAHVDHIDRVVARAMERAKIGFEDLDAVTAAAGPGLIGGVIVGTTTAKAIAAAHRIPFLAINHLEGHALSVRLDDGNRGPVAFPYLLLLVSGGHCQLLIVEGVGTYRRLGTTIDDAVGEAFDKVAKLLGLGFPGGPAIEEAAAAGNWGRFPLPRPLKGRPSCDFSFSGLKTAVRHTIDRLAKRGLEDSDVADLAASFQAAVADVLVDRTNHAIERFQELYHGRGILVVAGGVAANQALRMRLEKAAAARAMKLVAPPPRLCTDNGAMIAWAGVERLRLGHSDPLDFAPRARWPLDPDAPPAPFAGVKA